MDTKRERLEFISPIVTDSASLNSLKKQIWQ